jgi:hypothetical protein
MINRNKGINKGKYGEIMKETKRNDEKKSRGIAMTKCCEGM